MYDWWWIGVLAIGLFGGCLVLARWILSRRQHLSIDEAHAAFYRRREWLEADFVTQASASGKPRGLRWVNCDFDDQVEFARDRQTGKFRALVGVTISFEAVEGGGMEEVEAVGNLRAATVVFRLDGPAWEADGRAYFNLSPSQTIEHYHNELESVKSSRDSATPTHSSRNKST